MNVRTAVVEEGILVSLVKLCVQRRDGSVDIQTAQSCAVEIVTVLQIVGWHPTRRKGSAVLRREGDFEMDER